MPASLTPDNLIDEISEIFEESNRVLDKKLRFLNENLSPYLKQKNLSLKGFDGSMPYDNAILDQMLIIGHTLVQSPDCYNVEEIEFCWIDNKQVPTPTFQFRINNSPFATKL